MNHFDMLKTTISDDMSVPDIVSAFEKMCEYPIENDMVLFETGTFSFTGEPLFHFILVRQFPNDNEEYYQIHVDVLFEPDSRNQVFSEAMWNEEIDGNIFDYVRGSEAYEYAKTTAYKKIDIYMDET